MPPSLPLPALPPVTSVIDDLPCRTCGYNLRTLATEAVCPECATPVALSMRSELLRDADPNWVRQIKLGCSLFRAGVVLKFLAWAGHVAWCQLLLAPIGSALMLAGAWLFTIPDPSGLGESRNYNALRTWARVTALINFPISLTAAFAIPVLSRLTWYRELQTAFATTCAILLILYLMRMASRLRRDHVAGSMRSLMLLYAGASVIVLLLHLRGFGVVRFLGPLWMLVTAVGSFAEVFYFFFLLQAISTFYGGVKEEAAAAIYPASNSLWRSAGSFLYSARQLFRRNNGDND